jgi:uncharacterized protein YkwD
VSWSVLNGNAIIPASAVLGPAPDTTASISVQSETVLSNGSPVQLTAEELQLFNQTNKDRESANLPDLELDPLLCQVAKQHSQDMCNREYFGHMAPLPGPSSPLDRYLAALTYKPDYALVGENIYYRSATDPNCSGAVEADSAFMRSPSHKANILRPLFTSVGIGLYRDPASGAFWVTETFLRDQK